MYNFNILLGVCGKGLQHDDVKVLMYINVKKTNNKYKPFSAFSFRALSSSSSCFLAATVVMESKSKKLS